MPPHRPLIILKYILKGSLIEYLYNIKAILSIIIDNFFQ